VGQRNQDSNANGGRTINMTTPQARLILALACRVAASTTFERTRKRLEKRFQRELVRVIKFAKHETLRKLHRYMYSHRPLMGADEPLHPDANRIAFDPRELLLDLRSMLATEVPLTLSIAASDNVAGAMMVSQDVLDFVSRRQNLLSGIPDEIFEKIRSEISLGLTNGESIAEISARITTAFAEIEKDRATMIAESETSAAYSYANDKASRAAGIMYKRWIHGNPMIPREDHLGIDGLIVPIDEPFPVGSPPLMYPHDERGSPQDVINCTCISVAATEEEFLAQ
jgi:hypothetical protein